MRTFRRRLLGCVAAAATCLAASAAGAMCDVIPGVTQEFRGARGSLNRPFAIPNDDGEEILVRLRPVCEPDSAGFANLPGGEALEDDYFVTVLFEPPAAGARNAVVLGTEANQELCTGLADQAGALPGGGRVRCGPTLGSPRLLRIERECIGGSGAGQVCTDAAQCGGGPCLPFRLRFRFPDTDALVGTPDDDRTLTGPATIAVTPVTGPLPLGLASARCADTPGLTACIDELYARDGTCETTPAHIDSTFGHFTALPPANDYQGLCETLPPDGPCEPGRIPENQRQLRLAIDAAGNALIPMDYRGVLIQSNEIPVPRLIRGHTGIERSPGGGPVVLGSDDLIASYSPGGHRLPPIFTPIRDPAAPDGLSLFGSVDAPVGVIRVEAARACVGGPTQGAICSSAAQCGGGTCEPLFDLATRLFEGAGPILVSEFQLETENPVPLDGLIESESMFAFVQAEAIAGASDPETGESGPRNLNGDADETDPVLVLRDRETGQIQPIGAVGVAGIPARGRAATRIHEPPFSYPAVAVEGDLVAFLEPEPLQGDCRTAGGCDQNCDGDVFDTLLRVYRRASGCAPGSACEAEELTAGINRVGRREPDTCGDAAGAGRLAIDALPLVAGRSLALSGGRVFFRTSEAAIARQRTDPAGRDLNPLFALSGDGRFLAVDTLANVRPPRPCRACPQPPDVLVARVSLFDRVTRATTPVSGEGAFVSNRSALGHRVSAPQVISHTGRFIVFSNLTGSALLYDREREPSGISPIDLPPPDGSVLRYNEALSISPDGRFVTVAQGYRSPQGVDAVRTLVLDRVTSITTPFLFLLPPGWTPGAGPLQFSADGRLLTMQGNASFDERDVQALFLVDRETGESSFGSPILDCSIFGCPPFFVAATSSISGDGRLAAFPSDADNLVPGDTNGGCDIFVHDRASGRTDRVSVGSDGSQQLAASPNVDGIYRFPSCFDDFTPLRSSLSANGRFVAFESSARNLVPGSYDPRFSNIFVRDRLTGLTSLLTGQDFGETRGGLQPSISADGRTVAFESGGFLSDVFLRGPDLDDGEADLSGDEDLDDAVLQVLDTATGQLANLGSAEEVAVAAGAAAFLAPRESGQKEVFLSRDGQTAVRLHREAVSIAMSENLIGALVPSPPGGATFAEIYDWASASPTWVATGSEATALDVVGTNVALLTPDRALRLYRAEGGLPLIDVGSAVEEFVLGERLLAFRIRECTSGELAAGEECPGGTDLNGDGDAKDRVLHVYDLETGRLFNTLSAAIPCPLEACDPRFPYRVQSDTVVYITAEVQQGRDLNEDGVLGFVKQVFKAREAAALVPQAAALVQASGVEATPAGGCVDTIAAAPSGICTNTGEACSCDSPEACEAACGAGVCFLPPGGCIEDLVDTFCDTNPGFCRVRRGSCASDADCARFGEGIACFDDPQDVQRLLAPIAAAPGGGELLVSAGRCVEAGLEGRPQGSCRTHADCQSGLVCSADLILAAAADSDSDELADVFDNCPDAANADQADFDQDEIGDACDLMTCGNGVPEFSEECDDGNRSDGDCCSDGCRITDETPPVLSCSAAPIRTPGDGDEGDDRRGRGRGRDHDDDDDDDERRGSRGHRGDEDEQEGDRNRRNREEEEERERGDREEGGREERDRGDREDRRDAGTLRISFAAGDSCGAVRPESSIDLGCSEVPVRDGELVAFERDDDCEAERGRRGLEIESRRAVLRVEATDAAGNSAVCTVDLATGGEGIVTTQPAAQRQLGDRIRALPPSAQSPAPTERDRVR